MKGFVDAHVASGRGSVIGGKDVATKRAWDDNQHEKFFVILDGLEDNKLVVNDRDMFLANIVTVGRVERSKIGAGEGGASEKASKEEGTIRVLVVGGCPIERGRNRPGVRGGGFDGKAVGDKTLGGLGGV